MAHFYDFYDKYGMQTSGKVSMPSRADDSFLRLEWRASEDHDDGPCQCPLGLMTHFYAPPEGSRCTR